MKKVEELIWERMFPHEEFNACSFHDKCSDEPKWAFQETLAVAHSLMIELSKAKSIEDYTRYELTGALRRRGCAVAVWSTPDVESVVEEHFRDDPRLAHSPLTEAEMEIILEAVDRKQDCNYGITWDTLRAATNQYLNERL